MEIIKYNTTTTTTMNACLSYLISQIETFTDEIKLE